MLGEIRSKKLNEKEQKSLSVLWLGTSTKPSYSIEARLRKSEKLANEIKFCNGEGRDTAEEIEKKRGKEKVGKKIWHGKKIKI